MLEFQFANLSLEITQGNSSGIKFKTLEFEFENQLPWNIHGECLNNTYQRFLGPREVKLFGI